MWTRRWAIGLACGVPALFCAVDLAASEDAKPAYPTMAPVAQYRMTPQSEEIALARSAAPNSISDYADVLTLGSHGYETAVKGKNGFVCIVERSWAAGFDDPEFWNPKVRSPICFNAAAARSVVPGYLERTKWVLEGVSKPGMIGRVTAALTAKTWLAPEPGAMCYMMSKRGYVSDTAGHWHPHLMFFVARTDGGAWGADLDGSPVFSAYDDPEPVTTFFVLVTTWSDGTPAMTDMH
jgi:hypothetical protein